MKTATHAPGHLVIGRLAAIADQGGSTASAILVIVLVAIVLVGAWYFVLDGGRRPSVTVNPIPTTPCRP